MSISCEFSRNVKFLGISLWWYGAIYFLSLIILGFSKKKNTAWLISLIAIVLDLFLLILMLFIGVCINCLIAAVIMLIVFFFTTIIAEKVSGFTRTIAAVWFIFIISNTVEGIKENIKIWPIYGKQTANVKVFISPTCPACLKTLNYLLDGDIETERVAFYPVAISIKDKKLIVELYEQLERGVAFKTAVHDVILTPKTKDKDVTKIDLLTEFRLIMNYIYLNRCNGGAVPLVLNTGGY